MVGYPIKSKYLILILIIIILLYSWGNSKQEKPPDEIEIDFHNSFLADFKVENEKVYFYCKLTLLNHSNSLKNIKLTAESSEDVKGGLIKDKSLCGFGWGPGFDTISSYNIFTLPENSQPTEVNVVFIGEYNFRSVKHDRNIPDIIKIEIVDESISVRK